MAGSISVFILGWRLDLLSAKVLGSIRAYAPVDVMQLVWLVIKGHTVEHGHTETRSAMYTSSGPPMMLLRTLHEKWHTEDVQPWSLLPS